MNYVIGKKENGRMAGAFLAAHGISDRTLAALKKKPTGILLNGSHITVRTVLHEGDVLSIDLTDETNENISPVRLPLHIVYEDEAVIAVDKPAFMPTHPSHNHYYDTLANALAFRYAEEGRPFVFRPINRLDADTTGIVLLAKDRLSASLLSASLKDRRFEKHYLAVLHGILEDDEGRIVRNIRRALPSIIARETCDEDEGEYAETRYRVLSRGKEFTVVDANPVTGRTHQIRVHFASLGHPLVCDFLYGREEHDLIRRQALHCSSLSFPHPMTGKRLTVSAPLPDDMQTLIGKDSR